MVPHLTTHAKLFIRKKKTLQSCDLPEQWLVQPALAPGGGEDLDPGLPNSRAELCPLAHHYTVSTFSPTVILYTAKKTQHRPHTKGKGN